MNTTYRVLGQRGRITIPYELRCQLGFQKNDIVSFQLYQDTIQIKKEHLCSAMELKTYLDGLTKREQHDALVYLTAKLAEQREV